MVQANDPLFLIHDGQRRVGVVLCHGFTGSTAEINDCGEWLHEQGFHVATVLLPGHGTSPADLAQTRWEDWYARLEETYRRLLEKSERVFLIGISLGGLLSLRVAALHPEVAGVITMGTPLKLVDPLARRWIIQIGRLFIQTSHTQVDPGQEGYYYDERPLVSILELMEVRDEVRKRLKQVHCPVLIMHSRRDQTASFKAVKILMKNLSSEHKFVYATDIPQHVFLPPYNNPLYMKEWQLVKVFLQHPTTNPVL